MRLTMKMRRKCLDWRRMQRCATMKVMKAQIGAIYQHYKAKEMKYKVLTIAIQSETLEEMVVYECLYDNPRGKIWVRPRKMFEEKVKVNGEWKERFKEILTN